jgi:hypothetical protein
VSSLVRQTMTKQESQSIRASSFTERYILNQCTTHEVMHRGQSPSSFLLPPASTNIQSTVVDEDIRVYVQDRLATEPQVGASSQRSAIRICRKSCAELQWRDAQYPTGTDRLIRRLCGLEVKLKKDYIPGLGDSVDLVVVGGRRDPAAVRALGLGKWAWTNFYLACVEEKSAERNGEAEPAFRIVGEVSRPRSRFETFDS